MQPLVACDLGSTKVACAVGLPHEHAPGFELLGSSLIAYPITSETWLSDPLTVSQAIEEALEATAVTGELQRALVIVSHPALVSHRVRTSVTLADEPATIRALDLERLRQGALDQALGIDREALMVEPLGCTGNGFDGVRDPRGLTATRLIGTFHVLTIPLGVDRAVVQAVESAGLEVAQLSYTLPAVLAGVADPALRQSRALVIDVGGVAADVGLFTDGVLHRVAIAPWGGMTLAMSIATKLRVTMSQAMTWSLEGMACRKPEVRALLQQRWQALQQAIDEVLQDQPRPDAVILAGRGALIDGFAEWVERTTGVATSIGRSPRVHRLGDLARQVGVSPAIGLLELATRTAAAHPVRSNRLADRIIHRTRTLLTEYF